MNLTKLSGPSVVNVVIRNDIDWSKKVSIPQLAVKSFLYPFWKNSICLEEFRIPGSKLRLDLVNFSSMVIVEVSPDSYHLDYNSFLHKSRIGFAEKIKAEDKKREWAKRNEFEYIELYDDDIENLSQQYILEKFGVSL